MENRNVIIVNDSKFEAKILSDILSKLGMCPLISDEFRIMRDIKHHHASMVIVNYILEDRTGDYIIEQIKRRFPNTVCILSSSNSLHIKDFSSESIDQIIKTPITMDQMNEIIHQYLPKESNQCSHCGKTIQNDFMVCPYCGIILKIRA